MRRLLLTLLALGFAVPVQAALTYHATYQETSGTAVNDSSASNFDGVFASDISGFTATGPGGSYPNAISHNGTSSTANALGANRTFATTTGTVAFWIKRDDVTLTESVMSRGNDATHIRFVGNNVLRVRINSVDNDITLGSAMVNGTWYHIAITKDGSNNLTAHVNAVAQADVENESGSIQISTIGGSVTSASYLGGDLADVRAYDSDETAILAAIMAEGVTASSSVYPQVIIVQ